MVVSLDLLSGITEGLQASVESLVAHSHPPLVNLLYRCSQVSGVPACATKEAPTFCLADRAQPDTPMSGLFFQDVEPEVRQSAFALLGDMAGACFIYLEPVANDFVIVQIANLNTMHLSVCNNAVWSLGEVAIRYGTTALRA